MHIIDYMNLFLIPANIVIVILALLVHHRHPEFQNLQSKEKHIDILEIISVAIVMLVGTLIRFVNLTGLPAGLHQDEASIGYEAFALANFGIDRNGYNFPVYPVTYGSGGGSPMLIYINMITTKLFGSSVATLRGTTAFFGVLTLLLFYLIIRRLWDKKTAFTGLLLLTLMPWHIILSRWSLDSNTMPFFICLATLVFIYAADYSSFKSDDKIKVPTSPDSKLNSMPLSDIDTESSFSSGNRSKHIATQTFLYCISAALYALCLYNYGSATIVVPLHLIIICIYCIRHKRLSIKQLLYSICTFIVVMLPLIVFYCINYLDLPELVTPWFSFEKFTSNRIGQVFVTFDSTLPQQLWTNFKALLRMITIGCTTETESLVNFLPGFSLLFEFTFPITFLGIGTSIARIYHGRVKKVKYEGDAVAADNSPSDYIASGNSNSKYEGDAVMLSLLTSSCIMALFMQADTSRMVIIFIPLIYFMTMGFKFIFEQATFYRFKNVTGNSAKFLSVSGIKRFTLRLAAAFSGFTVITAGCLFLYEYSTEYNDMTSYIFMPGYGEAMAAADKLYYSSTSENNLSTYKGTENADSNHEYLKNAVSDNDSSGSSGIHVYSTYDNVSAPYMVTLYYTQTPPADFCETVKYKDDTAEFRMASSFTHFVFGFDQSLDSKITAAQNDADAALISGKDLSDNIYVVSHAQEAAFDTATCEITEYGNYAVVVKKG